MPEIAIDAHVHFHAPADAPQHLVAACRRLAADRRRQPLRVFMLAEQAGCDAYAHLRHGSRPTRDPAASWASIDGVPALLVRGRQMVSGEGIEVLGLGYGGPPLDGRPAAAIVTAVREAGGIAVLPWGAGKWIGRRGRLVARLLEADPQLLRGDNGGRPHGWPPGLLAHDRLLSGSDPLPVAGSWTRIGTFGTGMDAELSDDDPWADLRLAIADGRRPLRPFGAPNPLHRFVCDQMVMRMRT